MKRTVPVREQLIALRKKRGLSQRDLAELLGVTQPVIADFESKPRTSLRPAMRIAEALAAEIRVELVAKYSRSEMRRHTEHAEPPRWPSAHPKSTQLSLDFTPKTGIVPVGVSQRRAPKRS